MRKGGTFCNISTNKTVKQQMKELAKKRAEGVVKISPRLADAVANARGELPWATDEVMLVPQKTLVCYQAALVHAAARSLVALGNARLRLELLTTTTDPSCALRRALRYCRSASPSSPRWMRHE